MKIQIGPWSFSISRGPVFSKESILSLLERANVDLKSMTSQVRGELAACGTHGAEAARILADAKKAYREAVRLATVELRKAEKENTRVMARVSSEKATLTGLVDSLTTLIGK